MAVPPTNPHNTPPSLTAAQTRALLHTLLTTNLNAPRPNSTNPSAPTIKLVRQQPVQQQAITIDASTRIMGHCNNVALASPSPAEQAVKMEEVLRGALQLAGPGEEKTKARALVNLSVNIQAGVSIMGSKNVVVLNGKRDVSKDSAKDDEPLAAERKRRAESEPAGMPKKVGKKVRVDV
ncbi:MAG: hypothetical protein ASARMPREDX12_006512 [Alectoria sarmentosa]|nr:MAG: hypothetical protein ASARMPRED_004247 [Alectoria sarmentosa]CAD6574314.1 MAG: hypothetical protein ASARMPREDX12_006512 [Alectoria sarmentosa]